jgi:hypothetical protein
LPVGAFGGRTKRCIWGSEQGKSDLFLLFENLKQKTNTGRNNARGQEISRKKRTGRIIVPKKNNSGTIAVWNI